VSGYRGFATKKKSQHFFSNNYMHTFAGVPTDGGGLMSRGGKEREYII
jgi:hypothetical protein